MDRLLGGSRRRAHPEGRVCARRLCRGWRPTTARPPPVRSPV